MKLQRNLYRIFTTLLVLVMLANVANYFINPAMKPIFVHIGFPDWFRVELGVFKLLGALAIAIPSVPARLKEWAYLGFFLSFFSAMLAHYNVGDPAFTIIFPFVMIIILVISYMAYHKVKDEKISA
ncbi:DoxX family protein [Cytophagaceae bacterium DM2B3-1]|uniref:DoxX family protein n=1 Tax=Xanthocytophaga flava TaxID=3048013 RepID=A0AAE3QGD1_9BACT|nr:DoxX family protein [Xanthocytophaga flavus]MDJ1466197.1 DoxX family protein [Xanthocytophaga flavus]MDJ1478867.1 DoxX family protein [Xanthocytophaga flavus]MDJ1495402.1 DoxX family protein [Xanthocytophaga flavus]